MSATSDQNPQDSSPVVCRSCRFGSGPLRDCSLIAAGDTDRLVLEGPCGIEAELTSTAEHLLLRQGKDVGQAAQVCNALLARLSGRQAILSNLGMSRLPEFSNWLELQLASAVDEVGSAPAAPVTPAPAVPSAAPSPVAETPRAAVAATSDAPVIRCGSCQHFVRDGGGRCGLEFLNSEGAELAPNPWWSAPLARDTDPRDLDPPCRDFRRHEVGGLDPFEGLVEARPLASRRDEAARILCLALDRLAARGPDALARAALFQAHHLEKRSLAELARSSGKSEGQLEILLARARQELTDILESEFATGGPRER